MGVGQNSLGFDPGLLVSFLVQPDIWTIDIGDNSDQWRGRSYSFLNTGAVKFAPEHSPAVSSGMWKEEKECHTVTQRVT